MQHIRSGELPRWAYWLAGAATAATLLLLAIVVLGDQSPLRDQQYFTRFRGDNDATAAAAAATDQEEYTGPTRQVSQFARPSPARNCGCPYHKLAEKRRARLGLQTPRLEAVKADQYVFIISNVEDAREAARLHASPKNEIIFTTYQFTHKGRYSYEAINMAKHSWENMREVGIQKHFMVLTYDVHSCQVMWEHGIPCFLDRWLPQPAVLPGQYGSDVPHWYQKYAWGLKFIEFGYTAAFMEFDTYFFSSPLPYQNPQLDLQGLSDWRRVDLGSPKDRFTGPCMVYHSQKGANNDNYLDWGGNRPEDPASHYHINPCMSTGFWFVQPHQATKDFLAGFIDLELHWRPWQTDQVLWNEVIMAYLIGHGEQAPLKFGLLNTTQFSNFEVDDERKRQGLARQPVMLHAGAMSGAEKEPYMRAEGYWRADAWNVSGAAGHIAFLRRHLALTTPY